MTTTRIQISFNNLFYPIDISSSTCLSKAQKLFIETTQHGFHLTCEHPQELEYLFTYQPHQNSQKWKVVCLMGNRNIRSSIEEWNLNSMWTTLKFDEQWLIYGQAATIGSIFICCLTVISLWFSIDYQNFSKRDLKVLTASSFTLTWLNLFFVYDTSKAISENSYILVDTLISVVNSLETPQEESIEILENECDVEESQNDFLGKNRLSAISRQIENNHSQIQQIKKLLARDLSPKTPLTSPPSQEQLTNSSNLRSPNRIKYGQYQEEQLTQRQQELRKKIESMTEEEIYINSQKYSERFSGKPNF